MGTQVTIELPRCNPPRWFCDELTINHDAIIVILDDDPSIHDTWENKLFSWPSVRRIHFSKAADLTLQKVNDLKPHLYLIDYELLSDAYNGLDVIESLEINEHSCLVTSCFEDINVRYRAEKLGIKIIPKSYVPYLSIHITNKTPSLVLIDDDNTIRMVWEFAAAEAGKTIDVYSHPDDFILNIHRYSKDTPIYIDSDLKSELPGEIYAKDLYEKGFKEIHLASGYEPGRFGQMGWIKSIVGKIPPF